MLQPKTAAGKAVLGAAVSLSALTRPRLRPLSPSGIINLSHNLSVPALDFSGRI